MTLEPAATDDEMVTIAVRVLRRHLPKMQDFRTPTDDALAWIELSRPGGTVRLPVTISLEARP